MAKDFNKEKWAKRKLKAKRVRTKIKKVSGLKYPRLSVFRSNRHIYAQLIDLSSGCVLASASDIEISSKEKNKKVESMNKTDLAFKVGELIAKKAKEKNITKVVFDRGFYKYHGRVKALAEGARKNGLIF